MPLTVCRFRRFVGLRLPPQIWRPLTLKMPPVKAERLLGIHLQRRGRQSVAPRSPGGRRRSDCRRSRHSRQRQGDAVFGERRPEAPDIAEEVGVLPVAAQDAERLVGARGGARRRRVGAEARIEDGGRAGRAGQTTASVAAAGVATARRPGRAPRARPQRPGRPRPGRRRPPRRQGRRPRGRGGAACPPEASKAAQAAPGDDKATRTPEVGTSSGCGVTDLQNRRMTVGFRVDAVKRRLAPSDLVTGDKGRKGNCQAAPRRSLLSSPLDPRGHSPGRDPEPWRGPRARSPDCGARRHGSPHSRA